MLINLDAVATGALVNAVALIGRRLGAAVDRLLDRSRLEDLYTAQWFDTYRITQGMPSLSAIQQRPEAAGRLADILKGDEIQAALQELLATRLTDAPEVDATRARQILLWTITTTSPEAAAFAATLADYYDDQICGMVARLEADAQNFPTQRKLLAQIRSEAFGTRIIRIVDAIERHTASLATRPSQPSEEAFLSSYRRHILEQHGKLEPPDFDRRRRVPIDDIYVPTSITADTPLGTPLNARPPLLDVWKLATVIDRSVLLGTPGGGKTTAASVLMHHVASSEDRIPFLVTLRHYAAKNPPEHSIAGHIEYTLETFYQSPSPSGMIDLLLLTGRAIVIFDGLDELVDTSRRADMTARVEHFCAEYPLTPVMVTSRVIGYDQARLDPQQFSTYTLRGFTVDQVAEYAHKWFAQDTDAQTNDADTFLIESTSVPDLRSNPLMLALLCILYRGGGSLPRNRAEVYEQCASLLFRKWDARRKIHQELRAGPHLEPTLRHLAWWLLTRDNVGTAVTERELITQTSGFLHGRGFEFEDVARDAAREFVEFCWGRMWVFTDAGTTAAGQRLYSFTHRTFLEYFAAAQLAYECDSPEQLGRYLAELAGIEGLSLVSELAMQIKDHTSNNGAQRIYGEMMGLSYPDLTESRSSILRFLALCLRSVDPSPQRVRELTRKLAIEIINDSAPAKRNWSNPARELIIQCGAYQDTVADELASVAGEAVLTGSGDVPQRALLLAASLPDAAASAGDHIAASWEPYADSILATHVKAVAAAAQHHIYLRRAALAHGYISPQQALEMRGGLNGLFRKYAGLFPDEGRWGPYIEAALRELLSAKPISSASVVMQDLAAIGEYLQVESELPWVDGIAKSLTESLRRVDESERAGSLPYVDEVTYLGAAAVIAIVAESREDGMRWTPVQFGQLRDLYPYLTRRHNSFGSSGELPDLPLPDEFKKVFKDWASGKIDLIAAG